jgi:hypothetical protein
MNVTIFHNPACGTSRNTLALIRHAGIEPDEAVVEHHDLAGDKRCAGRRKHRDSIKLRRLSHLALRAKGLQER